MGAILSSLYLLSESDNTHPTNRPRRVGTKKMNDLWNSSMDSPETPYITPINAIDKDISCIHV